MFDRLKFLTLILSLLLAQHVIATAATAQDRCSFTSTNHDCVLKLDRNSFVSPAPLQMYPRSVITVMIKNGTDYELYTLDPAPGQATPLPDVTSTALGNLNTILAAASALGAASTIPAQPAEQAENYPEPTKPNPCDTSPKGEACKKYNFEKYNSHCDFAHVSQFSSEDCMLDLLNEASQQIVDATGKSKKIYGELDTLLTPDSQPPLAHLHVPSTSRQHVPFEHLLQELCGTPSIKHYPNAPCGLKGTAEDQSLIHQQAVASVYVAALLVKLTKSPTDVFVPQSDVSSQLSQTVLSAMQLVTEEQAALDAIRKDLEGYASRLQDLATAEGNRDTQPAPKAITVGYIQDVHIGRHVTRTINYTLNRLNLVSNSQEAANDGSKKVPIVTIVVIYGEAHWEASTGVALVFRPIRTFTIAPILTGVNQTGAQIAETKAGPEVAPFAAADYRLGDDFKIFGWRSAFYATGGVGYNTSQETADLFVGPSFSWRGVMLSALCDFGHGSRLSQGLAVGDSLGSTSTTTTSAGTTTTYTPPTFTTLPTTNYWVPAFTIGISIRIPGITGR